MEEKEVLGAFKKHEDEAIKIVADAFNEGFMLGRQYAEKLYNEKN